jgi:hypothetical protein
MYPGSWGLEMEDRDHDGRDQAQVDDYKRYFDRVLAAFGGPDQPSHSDNDLTSGVRVVSGKWRYR